MRPSIVARLGWSAILLLSAWASPLVSQDSAARRQSAIEFHLRAQQRTGILVPLYVYPENIHQNPIYNRLIALKRQYETVPIWVILNPASGPGTEPDFNYQKAMDRLQGAGCVVLGYVATGYGKRPAAQVEADLDRWREFYPRTHGIFFDEMIYEDNDAGAGHQKRLNQLARERGYWPTVGNPGADTPSRYFVDPVADVVVVHESGDWPPIERLHGDYFGGHADSPPFLRAVLIHSQNAFDPEKLQQVRKYVRWVYVTDDPYRPGDRNADNPWDSLSTHLEAMCEALSRD